MFIGLDSNLIKLILLSQNKLFHDLFCDLMNTSTEKEFKVLKLRYGLEDGNLKTLEDAGKIFHQSRARIGQIEAKAIRRLGHPGRSGKLIKMLEKAKIKIGKDYKVHWINKIGIGTAYIDVRGEISKKRNLK